MTAQVMSPQTATQNQVNIQKLIALNIARTLQFIKVNR